MLGNFGMGEMIVLLIIVLVLFGAKRIPEISASFGKGIREFKRNVNDVEGSIMSGANQPAPPRYDNRLSPADPLAPRTPAAPTPEETRPEPKRLL